MSTDKIWTKSDYDKQQQQAKEYCKTHPDPRHKYVIHFTYNKHPMTEEIWEMNSEFAEKLFRENWKKVGVLFDSVEVKEG